MIRELAPGEIAEVITLLEACHLPVADLEQAQPRFFGLRDEAGLAGVIGIEVHNHVGLLRSLAVREDQRGDGFGSCLVEYLEAWAREAAVTTLFLLTTTAEPFFLKRGWVRVERDAAPLAIRSTTEFTSACPASATVMVRELASGLA